MELIGRNIIINTVGQIINIGKGYFLPTNNHSAIHFKKLCSKQTQITIVKHFMHQDEENFPLARTL